MTRPRPVAGAHHVALSVADLDRSLRWWSRLLQVDVVLRESRNGRDAVVLHVRGTSFQLALVQHSAATGDRFTPLRTGLDHVAFTVAARSEMDAWAAHLDALGVGHSGVIDIPVGAILNAADPDGIAVALFWDADRPAGCQPAASPQQAAARTVDGDPTQHSEEET